ncbi:MFS general substrate transporter [Pluteus cervinus]|uniref:MFS general substrate transporter n=1 Tax=Pluteus cervinus TaxID=181527 RepID=A0ACD3BEA2_9AGAR|nr:MFS general substrate transporter [Pluteus cervinus]
MDSRSDHSSREKQEVVQNATVSGVDVDVAAHIADGDDVPMDAQVALRLRRKIDRHLLPLMCILYLMTFADKTTLGQSAVLGIIPGANLSKNQFNWLGTIFYLSFLVFEYPQNLALQRYPVGKWMSINIFIWAIALMAHAACKDFGGLFVVRFIMGSCEGAITPGFMIVTSMFYTREEQTKRVGYWFLMNGTAIIVLGFISFGVLHAQTSNFMPWQWLMIITGLLTLICAVLFWFFFPDSPTTAKFLTPEERVLAVQRIKVNQAGVENKRWKKDQFIETLLDPKTWVMALFAAVANIVNSLTNQRQLIINQFGFTPIQTTLLGCVDGVVDIVIVWGGVTLASVRWVGRGYAGMVMYIPATIGSILLITLPSHDKVGLLFSYWISIFSITPFAIFLGWVGTSTAGHTKRITTNAIVLIFYAIGNAAGPLMWEAKYQPRNRVPWLILTACFVVSALLLLALRTMLAMENAKREKEAVDDRFDNVYISQIQPDGKAVEKRVDRAFLDLTDRQNKQFRYLL